MIENIHFQKYCVLIFIFLLAYSAEVVSLHGNEKIITIDECKCSERLVIQY